MSTLDDLATRLTPRAFQEAAVRAANKAGALAVTRTRMRMSGRVLNRRSGALWNSVGYSVKASNQDVIALVYGGGPTAPYLKAHEFGATIRPKNPKGWLRFEIGGDVFFAKKVVLPERPTIGPSVRETFKELGGILSAEVRTALSGGS